MEGITQAAASRLAEYYRTHEIYRVEDNWYAWKPAPDGGELTHGRTEDELAAKLTDALGG